MPPPGESRRSERTVFAALAWRARPTSNAERRSPVALDRDVSGFARAVFLEAAAAEQRLDLGDHRGVTAQQHVVARGVELEIEPSLELAARDQRRQPPGEHSRRRGV